VLILLQRVFYSRDRGATAIAFSFVEISGSALELSYVSAARKWSTSEAPACKPHSSANRPAIRSGVWQMSRHQKAVHRSCVLLPICLTAACGSKSLGPKSPDEFLLTLRGDQPADAGKCKAVWRLGADVGAKLTPLHPPDAELSY
jgi:hypothetical protein